MGLINATQNNHKFTTNELIRAVRLDLVGEYKAIDMYLSHVDASNNKLARTVLTNIANEERAHAGELERLLEILTGDEKKYQQKGAREVNELLPNRPIKKTIKKSKRK